MKHRKIRNQTRERVAAMLLCSLVFCFVCGCQMKRNNEARQGATGAAATEQAKQDTSVKKEKKKKQNRLLVESDYEGISKAYNSWWFKRNADHMPSGAQEEIDIAKYNAFYKDDSVMQKSVPDKVIYLTFDCGYENGYTEGMLDVLKKHKAPAAFFVTQTYIRDNVAITKRMKEEGHIVGNHTITHPNLSEASLDKIMEEILGCQDYMKEATGYEMDLFFRPPKGEYSEYLLKAAQDLGYATIFWSMAYLDYDVNRQPSVEHVIEHFQKYYHPGAIPLIHNVSSANAGALDTVLTNLEQEGYRFGSLYELKQNEQ